MENERWERSYFSLKAIFISVRTGSTRLSNKSILKIKNKFTIEYVIDGVKKSMDYILKNVGPRQKVEVVNDGARMLLREN